MLLEVQFGQYDDKADPDDDESSTCSEDFDPK